MWITYNEGISQVIRALFLLVWENMWDWKFSRWCSWRFKSSGIASYMLVQDLKLQLKLWIVRIHYPWECHASIRRSGGTAPCILNHGTRWNQVARHMPLGKRPLHQSTPKTVDTLYNRKTSFPRSKVLTILFKGAVKIIRHKLLDSQIY